MKQNIKAPARTKASKVVHTSTINLKADPNLKKALSKDPGAVMVQIVKQQRSLYAKEITDWIAARQSALSPDFPQRGRLLDIYEDMKLDEFIHGQMYNHRILPVMNRAFKIVNANGDKDVEKAKFFKKRWFDNFIKYSLESIFFGFSLVFMKEIQMNGSTAEIQKLELVDRKHVLQEKGFIKTWDSDFIGQDFTAEPLKYYYLPIGETDDLGLLNMAVPLWIMKKHAWQNWDQFAEIFGIPIRIAKTASQDPRVIAEIEDWVKDMGTSAYGVFPDGTEIEIKENAKQDAYKVFYEMIGCAHEGLAILFSGQTMTSMDGSSKSQAEVHQDVASEIRKYDEKFITYEVNTLIELLRTKYGYPFDEGDQFEWDVPEDVKGLLEIFKAVDEMGFQLDAEEVSNRLGVKIVGLKAAAAPKDNPDLEAEKLKKETEAKELKKQQEAEKKKELTTKWILKLHAGIAEMYGGQNV